MKTLLALLLLITPLRAVDLIFEWDAPAAEIEVTSYNVYEWTSASERVLLGNTADPTFTASNVTPGVHAYEVTLVNLWGESVAYAAGTTPPVIPSPLNPKKLKFKAINLQASVDLQKWDDLATIEVPEAPGGRMFYQLAFAK